MKAGLISTAVLSAALLVPAAAGAEVITPQVVKPQAVTPQVVTPPPATPAPATDPAPVAPAASKAPATSALAPTTSPAPAAGPTSAQRTRSSTTYSGEPSASNCVGPARDCKLVNNDDYDSGWKHVWQQIWGGSVKSGQSAGGSSYDGWPGSVGGVFHQPSDESNPYSYDGVIDQSPDPGSGEGGGGGRLWWWPAQKED